MKQFIFISKWVIDANTEEEAWEIFADTSQDFAAEAVCYEKDEYDDKFQNFQPFI